MGKRQKTVMGVAAPSPRLTFGAALFIALVLALPAGAGLALLDLWLR